MSDETDIEKIENLRRNVTENSALMSRVSDLEQYARIGEDGYTPSKAVRGYRLWADSFLALDQDSLTPQQKEAVEKFSRILGDLDGEYRFLGTMPDPSRIDAYLAKHAQVLNTHGETFMISGYSPDELTGRPGHFTIARIRALPPSEGGGYSYTEYNAGAGSNILGENEIGQKRTEAVVERRISPGVDPQEIIRANISMRTSARESGTYALSREYIEARLADEPPMRVIEAGAQTKGNCTTMSQRVMFQDVVDDQRLAGRFYAFMTEPNITPSHVSDLLADKQAAIRAGVPEAVRAVNVTPGGWEPYQSTMGDQTFRYGQPFTDEASMIKFELSMQERGIPIQWGESDGKSYAYAVQSDQAGYNRVRNSLGITTSSIDAEARMNIMLELSTEGQIKSTMSQALEGLNNPNIMGIDREGSTTKIRVSPDFRRDELAKIGIDTQSQGGLTRTNNGLYHTIEVPDEKLPPHLRGEIARQQLIADREVAIRTSDNVTQLQQSITPEPTSSAPSASNDGIYRPGGDEIYRPDSARGMGGFASGNAGQGRLMEQPQQRNGRGVGSAEKEARITAQRETQIARQREMMAENLAREAAETLPITTSAALPSSEWSKPSIGYPVGVLLNADQELQQAQQQQQMRAQQQMQDNGLTLHGQQQQGRRGGPQGEGDGKVTPASGSTPHGAGTERGHIKMGHQAGLDAGFTQQVLGANGINTFIGDDGGIRLAAAEGTTFNPLGDRRVEGSPGSSMREGGARSASLNELPENWADLSPEARVEFLNSRQAGLKQTEATRHPLGRDNLGRSLPALGDASGFLQPSWAEERLPPLDMPGLQRDLRARGLAAIKESGIERTPPEAFGRRGMDGTGAAAVGDPSAERSFVANPDVAATQMPRADKPPIKNDQLNRIRAKFSGDGLRDLHSDYPEGFKQQLVAEPGGAKRTGPSTASLGDAAQASTAELRVGQTSVEGLIATSQAQVKVDPTFSPTAVVAANDGKAGAMTDAADAGGRNSAAQFMPKATAVSEAANDVDQPAKSARRRPTVIIEQTAEDIAADLAYNQKAAQAAAGVAADAVPARKLGGAGQALDEAARAEAAITRAAASNGAVDAAQAAFHAYNELGHVGRMGRLLRVGGQKIPVVGVALAGGFGAYALYNAEFGYQEGKLTDTHINAVRAALAPYVMTQAGSIVTGLAGEEAIDASLAAVGVPKEYRLGTLRDAVASGAQAAIDAHEFSERKANIPQPTVAAFIAALSNQRGNTPDAALNDYFTARDEALARGYWGEDMGAKVGRVPYPQHRIDADINDAARTYLAYGGTIDTAMAALSDDPARARLEGQIQDVINLAPLRDTKEAVYPSNSEHLEKLRDLKSQRMAETDPTQRDALMSQMQTQAANYLGQGKDARDALFAYYRGAPFGIAAETRQQMQANSDMLHAFDGADGSKRDGKISMAEIGQKLLNMGVYTTRIDANRDGEADFKELQAVYRNPEAFKDRSR